MSSECFSVHPPLGFEKKSLLHEEVSGIAPRGRDESEHHSPRDLVFSKPDSSSRPRSRILDHFGGSQDLPHGLVPRHCRPDLFVGGVCLCTAKVLYTTGMVIAGRTIYLIQVLVLPMVSTILPTLHAPRISGLDCSQCLTICWLRFFGRRSHHFWPFLHGVRAGANPCFAWTRLDGMSNHLNKAC